MLLNRPMQDEQIPQDPMPQEDPAAMGEDPDIPDGEEASEEDEAEMQRAQGALGEALYKNEKVFNSVVEKLQASDTPPINKLSDTTIFLVTEIDKKINIDEGVLLPFVGVVYDALYEIAQTAKAFELSDSLLKKGLMVTIELALRAYGVSEEEFNEYAESIGEQDADRLINFYKKESSHG